MEKDSECQSIKTELGIGRSTSTKNQVLQEATSGIIDLTQPSSGYSISSTEAQTNFSLKDTLSISDAEFG